jgi:dTMP kinase
MYAARRDHIERVIAPALERGDVVVCDRFLDSTRAYQGAAGGASMSLVASLEAEVAIVRPDLTAILDLSPEQGLARVDRRAEAKTRFEARNLSFHIALREAFLKIARAEPGRCVVIDAAGSVDAVAGDIWRCVEARL